MNKKVSTRIKLQIPDEVRLRVKVAWNNSFIEMRTFVHIQWAPRGAN